LSDQDQDQDRLEWAAIPALTAIIDVHEGRAVVAVRNDEGITVFQQTLPCSAGGYEQQAGQGQSTGTWTGDMWHMYDEALTRDAQQVLAANGYRIVGYWTPPAPLGGLVGLRRMRGPYTAVAVVAATISAAADP